VAGEDLPKAIGMTQAGMTLASILAPPIAGVLAGLYGARVPLLMDAVSFLAVLGAAILLHTQRRPERPPAGAKQRGGLAIVSRDALLRPLFVLLALFVLLGSMVNVVEVFLVRETLHASTVWYGITGAAFSAGALTGALVAGRAAGSVNLARGFVASTVLLALGLAGLGLVPAAGWLLPVGFVTGAGNGVLNVTLSSLVMGRAQAGERGRVGALLNGVASGTQLAAFAVSGVLAASLSPRTVFVLAGGLGLLAPLLFGRRVVRAAAAPDRADSAAMVTV
jgi:MFS family permease